MGTEKVTSTFSVPPGNTINEVELAQGGGIYNEGERTLINSTVSGNNADNNPDILDVGP
jgi:hypothetical protein